VSRPSDDETSGAFHESAVPEKIGLAMRLQDRCISVDNAVLRSATRFAAFALLLTAAVPLAAQAAGPGKFIQTFLAYYGGGPTLVASDAAKIAKFDLLDTDRFRYNQIGPDTWAAIKAVNPDIQIYLYENGAEAQNYMDALPPKSLNGLGRHDVSRGHSMGSLNGDHPELFLLDSAGNRIYNTAFSNVAANQFWYLMDFGSPVYQAYWVEAVKADIIDQPWVADGVHADLCVTFGASAAPLKYPDDAAWSDAMNNFARAITTGLHTYGQKLWCNKGSTISAAGVASWAALDNGPNPPDVMAEEGAFAVTWGPSATQFFPEASWKNQVDVMGMVKNSRVAYFSHTSLAEGGSGTDNWGQPVTYWQTLWYALGSFLLGKNDTLNNSYFFFSGNAENLNRIWWYDEYDHIDLGKALGSYAVTPIGGVNVYWREFERGYVFVNPTANGASLTLTHAGRQLRHDNLLSPPDAIPIVTSLSLGAHNAAIVLKAADATVPPAPPVPPVDTTPPVDATPPAEDPPTGSAGSSRCFIATAAYGSPMANDVRYLRAFRDQYLSTNRAGRWLVEQYYRLSPPLANELRAHDDWRAIVRLALSPLVALSKRLVSEEMLAKQTADRP
jgi:hypothetical protein